MNTEEKKSASVSPTKEKENELIFIAIEKGILFNVRQKAT